MEEKKTKKSLKKNFIAAFGLTAAAAAAFGISWAYYTSSQALANPLTTGDSSVAIVEEFDPTSSFLPGETVAKQVAFENTGDLDLFLRVEVPAAESWYLISRDQEGKATSQEKADLDTYNVIKNWTKAWPEEPVDLIKYLKEEYSSDFGEDPDLNLLTESQEEKLAAVKKALEEKYDELETSEWTRVYEVTQKDGSVKRYRYYKQILEAPKAGQDKNVRTNNILDSIKLSEAVSNDRHVTDYSDKVYKLTFNVEAIPVEDSGDAQYGISALWNMKAAIGTDGTVTWEEVQ